MSYVIVKPSDETETTVKAPFNTEPLVGVSMPATVTVSPGRIKPGFAASVVPALTNVIAAEFPVNTMLLI